MKHPDTRALLDKNAQMLVLIPQDWYDMTVKQVVRQFAGESAEANGMLEHLDILLAEVE